VQRFNFKCRNKNAKKFTSFYTIFHTVHRRHLSSWLTIGATAGNNKSDVHCNHIKTKGRPMFLLEPSHCVLTDVLQPDLRLVIRLVLVLKFCFVLMKIRFDGPKHSLQLQCVMGSISRGWGRHRHTPSLSELFVDGSSAGVADSWVRRWSTRRASVGSTSTTGTPPRSAPDRDPVDWLGSPSPCRRRRPVDVLSPWPRSPNVEWRTNYIGRSSSD